MYELNLDGLVGPTHHYAGLSPGNLASTKHALTTANPRAAAHQGLEKMRLLHRLGIKQALLPPHQRPNLALLSTLGFSGAPAQQIKQAYQENPLLLSACYSAASMWTANAATVSSSADTKDKRVHFSAANLANYLHRYHEAEFSSYLLKQLFANEQLFCHHPPLPGSLILGDEGAANHSRLCATHASRGINLFVYGKNAYTKFIARQTLMASEAIARRHLLPPTHTLFIQQHPEAINAGVFHNDVIAVANENVLFIHENAWMKQQETLHKLRQLADFPLCIIEVSALRISLQQAVCSYLFNSQLISTPTGGMILIAPKECEEDENIRLFLNEVLSSPTNPINKIYYLDLKQSMKNGGGPACLRLRIPLTEKEYQSMHQGVIVTHPLLDTLEQWVDKHYRSSLSRDDLRDATLLNESFTALDELTQILQLKAIYPFQQEASNRLW